MSAPIDFTDVHRSLHGYSSPYFWSRTAPETDGSVVFACPNTGVSVKVSAEQVKLLGSYVSWTLEDAVAGILCNHPVHGGSVEDVSNKLQEAFDAMLVKFEAMIAIPPRVEVVNINVDDFLARIHATPSDDK